MVNYLAVLVASVIAFIIPSIWFMPNVFGNKWIKLAKSKMKPSALGIIIGFVMTLVMVSVIGFVIDYIGVTNVYDGLFVGIALWIGLIAAPMFAIVNYERKP